jgi:hypothetical protein
MKLIACKKRRIDRVQTTHLIVIDNKRKRILYGLFNIYRIDGKKKERD